MLEMDCAVKVVLPVRFCGHAVIIITAMFHLHLILKTAQAVFTADLSSSNLALLGMLRVSQQICQSKNTQIVCLGLVIVRYGFVLAVSCYM